MKTKLRNQNRGFTIIEVMIVLTIAGLILLIVFLAVPALQRNSRNTQRKADVEAALAAVSEFASNNSGAIPAVACPGTAPSYTLAAGTCAAPTGTPAGFKLGYFTVTPTLTSTVPASLPATATDTLTIYTGATCNAASNAPTTTGASIRSVAAVYATEASSGLAWTCTAS